MSSLNTKSFKLDSLRSKRFRRAFLRFEAFFAFRTRENWGERKKVRVRGGEGKKGFLFSPPLPLPAVSISVALAPIFAPSKSERTGKSTESPTETLATQAIN